MKLDVHIAKAMASKHSRKAIKEMSSKKQTTQSSLEIKRKALLQKTVDKIVLQLRKSNFSVEECRSITYKVNKTVAKESKFGA